MPPPILELAPGQLLGVRGLATEAGSTFAKATAGQGAISCIRPNAPRHGPPPGWGGSGRAGGPPHIQSCLPHHSFATAGPGQPRKPQRGLFHREVPCQPS
jgi:hypothetical protein